MFFFEPSAVDDPLRMDLWPVYRALSRHAGARAEAKRRGADAEPGLRVVAALLELGAEIPKEAIKRIDFLELGKGVKEMIIKANSKQQSGKDSKGANPPSVAMSSRSDGGKYKAL
jgi:hypothetical protein